MVDFPFAKDTDLKWKLIALYKAMRDVAENHPETLRGMEGATQMIKYTEILELCLMQSREENHGYTRRMYEYLLTEAQRALDELNMTHTEHALRDLRKYAPAQGELIRIIEDIQKARIMGDNEKAEDLINKLRTTYRPNREENPS